MPSITHEDLVALFDVIERPEDYFPYGKNMDREGSSEDEYRGDCSCGCKWFAPLDGALRSDWGVCTNRASHRRGLLTFEHQGCPQFQMDPDLEADFHRAAAASRSRTRIEQPELYAKLYGDAGEPTPAAQTWPQLGDGAPIVLLIDLPAYGVRAGDVGTVLSPHANGAVFQTVFLSPTERTISYVELEARHLRPAQPEELAHVRYLYQLAPRKAKSASR